MKRLLSAADSACYIAKERGRNQVCVFEPDAAEQTMHAEQTGWVLRIQNALDEGRLLLYAQPIVETTRVPGALRHYELLLRMRNDAGNLVPPMAFIPAAERYHMMESIDRWVIHAAFTFIQQQSDVIGSINISGQSLGESRFLEYVKQELRDTGVDATRVCLEVTETAAIANFNKAVEFMSELRTLGCRFSLDDFGSGMSSFSYLRQLPMDFLKIDGAFVKNMVRDQRDLAMVDCINKMGHILGLQTIAEFVEDDAILEQLRILGVDYVQGYGIGKPMPLADIAIRKHDSHDIES